MSRENSYYLLYAVLGEFEADLVRPSPGGDETFSQSARIGDDEVGANLPDKENSRPERHRRQ
jgi:hypothetical protein